MKKDLQILWAAFKYHCRRIAKLFKEQKYNHDDQSNYYLDGEYQSVLYWPAYRRWQTKRFDRGQVNVGTDLFEKDTNISSRTKK